MAFGAMPAIAQVADDAPTSEQTEREMRNSKLRDVDLEWQRGREELSADRSRARREIKDEWSRKLQELNEQKLSTDEKRQRIAELNAEKDILFANETQSYQERLNLINANREQNRAALIAAQGEMLVDLQIEGPESNAEPEAARETGEDTEQADEFDARPELNDPQPAVETARPTGPVFVPQTLTTDTLSAIGSDQLSARGQAIADAPEFSPIILNTAPLSAVGSDELSARGRAIAEAGEFSPIILTTDKLHATGIEE